MTLFAALSAGAKTYLLCIHFHFPFTERLGGCTKVQNSDTN